MPAVIGLLGHAGAGKDTVASLIAERFHVARVAFADALKLEIAHAWGVDRVLLDSPWAKESTTPALALHRCKVQAFVAYAWELGLPGLQDGLTPRTVMQRWGDFRRACDPDYFVDRAFAIVRTVTERAQLDAVILTDVRFVNEAALVRGMGGQLWRVVRPGATAPTGHRSEYELADLQVDATIVNDGSLEQLAKIASDLMLYAMGRVEP